MRDVPVEGSTGFAVFHPHLPRQRPEPFLTAALPATGKETGVVPSLPASRAVLNNPGTFRVAGPPARAPCGTRPRQCTTTHGPVVAGLLRSVNYRLGHAARIGRWVSPADPLRTGSGEPRPCVNVHAGSAREHRRPGYAPPVLMDATRESDPGPHECRERGSLPDALFLRTPPRSPMPDRRDLNPFSGRARQTRVGSLSSHPPSSST